MIAPWRFIMFLVVLVIGSTPAAWALDNWWLGIMAAFDLGAVLFLVSCVPLLAIDDPTIIEDIARKNDAARTFLLFITGIVTAVLLIAIAAETAGGHPEPLTKWL